MSKEERKVPELRFKGFHDDWEHRKLNDVLLQMKSGLSRKLSVTDIGLPVIRANNINNGKLDLINDIKYWYVHDPQGAKTSNYLVKRNDILVNFINSESKMGTTAIVLKEPVRDTIYTTNIMKLKVNTKEYHPYFIFQQTLTGKYKNYIKIITKPAVNQSSFTTVDFKKYNFHVPNYNEQQKISSLLQNFDNLITLHQRKYVNLVKLKNVYLKKIFNQQLVFEDGKNDWKEIKFNEFMYRPKNLLKAKNIGKNELLTVKLFGKGITIANQNRALKLGATTYYKRYAGDFIYGKQNFFNGAFGFIDKNLDGYYSSGDVPTLKFNSEIIDRYFFLSYISRENYYKRTEAYSSGTGSKRIHEDTLLDFKIKAPIISEQRKIANLMCEIDDLVNDYSQRLKYLSDIKSLYINKMFI
ncbi:EcoKI restriction-modification system protein HsdS [Jeotgalicoccus saudimassiliensis]|uniref:EcoKI restriction-modification system protein HsdS n=1 Tax=Jeotgalicoccus saudimassiliensis TaxID=1461582 RepID=A0A078M0Q9_9STAP|nr:restriction endonuclease subunit S [Jeotgalicoccus saudimassiliensis]CDZ98987.1 EcoKI restriction-modification system protein HsdS [Jeotgalicoccus saudimassiliensis]